MLQTRYDKSRGTMTFTADLETLGLARGIPTDRALDGMTLRLTGTVDVTVNGTAVTEDAPCRVIRKIQVIAGGDGQYEPIANVDGVMLYYFNRYMRGVAPYLLAPSGFVIAAYPYAVNLYCPFSMLRSALDDEALLKLQHFTKCDVEVSLGNSADLIVGGTTSLFTGAAVAPAIEVILHKNRKKGNPTYKPYLHGINQVVEGSDAAWPVKLKAGAGLRMRSLLLIVRNNGARSNTLCTNVKLTSKGSTTDIPFGYLREKNKEHFQIETLPDGVAMLLLDEKGMMDGVPILSGSETPELELNVGSPTGDARVYVLGEYYDRTPTGAAG